VYRLLILILSAALCLVLSPLCAFGASSADSSTPVQLDEILVTGTPIKDDPSQPNTAIVVPSALLQGVGSTLDSALKRQPGIDVQRPQEVGGALDDDSIRIRGFGARRIAVTVDGRPLNTPGTAGGYFIDWTTIPLSNVDRIEVIKGVSDPRYGNTLGGAINLVTKKPLAQPVMEAQVSTGSYATRMTDFYHGWKPGRFEYSISGGYSASNGYLYNGDFRIQNLNLYVGYDLPWKGKLFADTQYVEVKKGFLVGNRLSKNYDSPLYDTAKDHRYPASDGEYMYGGMGAYPERGSWWKRERINYRIGYEQTLGTATMNGTFWQNHGDREAFNARLILNRVFHKEFYDDRSYGYNAGYKQGFGSSHVVTAGLDYALLQDDGDRNYPDDFRTSFRNDNYVNARNLGIFAMDDIYLLDRKLILTPGLRYLSYDGRPGPAGRAEGIKALSMNGLAPSFKVSFSHDRSLFYVSIARALRMPTPPEHYWHYSPDAGVVTSGLPFREEDGLMLQGGWKGTFGGTTKIEFSPYYYYIKNYIQFDLINFVAYNIKRAEICGIEFTLNHQLNRHFSFFTNYSLQKTSTDGDPFVANFVNPLDRDFHEIPGLPGHKVNAGLQYKGDGRERVTLYLTGVSHQKVIYNNNTFYNTDLRVRGQDSYATFDAEAAYPLTPNFELTGFIYNLLNAKYQERFGFPAAERNFGLGMRATF
jgi:outer membrane receptor protein involved in Fe transport